VSVDLVDHRHIDLATFDIGQQALEGRPVECAARDAAIVIPARDLDPTFRSLLADIRDEGRISLSAAVATEEDGVPIVGRKDLTACCNFPL
jgi:hypothetical protein